MVCVCVAVPSLSRFSYLISPRGAGGCFDAALSIAVLHHLSTDARRKLLVEQTMRVLRVGGEALFYAWALEQEEAPPGDLTVGDAAGERHAGRSGHRFEGKDVLVPFHFRVDAKGSAAKVAGAAACAASTTPVVAHPLGLSPVHGAAAESLRAAKSQSAEAAALCEIAEAAVSTSCFGSVLFHSIGFQRAAAWHIGWHLTLGAIRHMRDCQLQPTRELTNSAQTHMCATLRARVCELVCREASGMRGKKHLCFSVTAMSTRRVIYGSCLSRCRTGW